MKRALSVLAGLLLLAGFSSAEYVIIRINLDTEEASEQKKAADPGAVPGRRPGTGPGSPGTRGGSQGRPSLEDDGDVPGRRPGGRPRGGAPLAPGGGTPPSATPPAAGTPAKKEESKTWFITVVEADRVRKTGTLYYDVKHRWGNSILPKEILSGSTKKPADGGAGQPGGGYGSGRPKGRSGGRSPNPQPPAPPAGGAAPKEEGTILVKIDVLDRKKFELWQDRIDQHRNKLLEQEPKGSKSLSVAGMLNLADWMLQHWNLPTDDSRLVMQKKLEDLIDQMVKADAKHERVKLLAATRDSLKKPLNGGPQDVAALQKILGSGYRLVAGNHYAILHRFADESVPEQKLKRLEHLYAGWFYWFALQGHALKEPTAKQVVVLTESAREFDKLHKIFDSLPMEEDGFYSRFDRVAVFSPSRSDDPYQQVRSMAGALDSQGLNLQKLLSGEDLPRSLRDRVGTDQIMYGRVLALALQAGQEEGEIATVSHEGVQQLASATGLLSPQLHVPRAVRFGLSSLFETPKSTVIALPESVVKEGVVELPTLWGGIGAPSWTYLPLFKGLLIIEGKEFTLAEKTPDERKIKIEPLSIAAILTDKNWDLAEKADPEDRDLLRLRARTESWALTYFFARAKLANLLRFYEELNRLPREMDLPDELVLATFAKAFDLQDKTDPNKIDGEKMKTLDKAWRQFMGFQSLEYNFPEEKGK